MRSHFYLIALLFVVGSFALPQLVHASIPNFGPIVPIGDNVCPAGWGMLIQVINNIIEFGITLAVVFVAPIMIAYAGFKLVISQGNPAALGEARKILVNTVSGIVISLVAWTIVAAIMAALYNPDASSGTTSRLGTWSDLIRGDSSTFCIKQAGALPGDKLNQAAPPIGVTAGAGGGIGKFTFDSGIDAQISTQSGALSTLLSCMAGKVPAGVGRISSISDSKITSGAQNFKTCAAQGSPTCAHTVNSCHYGGTGRCNSESYAVDFGDEQNATALKEAAQACGGVILNEGNHVHISVGAQNVCGCDTRL